MARHLNDGATLVLNSVDELYAPIGDLAADPERATTGLAICVRLAGHENLDNAQTPPTATLAC